MLRCESIDVAAIRVLLCDADGTLFPSEEPAFAASADVTNRFLRGYDVDKRFSPTELRLATTGKNFRTTALDLARAYGIPLAPDLADHCWVGSASGEVTVLRRRALTAADLECWVLEERRVVTAHLRGALWPDPTVLEPLSLLSRRLAAAVVSSSASSRVAACLEATGLAPLFPEERRFSAEDSLPAPRSKPDPAIYAFAGVRLGATPDRALAVEDSVPGVQSAVAAGYTTIGTVQFVPKPERPVRVNALRRAGATAVISCWQELLDLLLAHSAASRR